VSTFELLPAVDLVGGRVVRLQQGDFARETIYADDPAGVARAFAAVGAQWLHVVDLDGARAGEPRQLDVVAAIAAATARNLTVEAAGGLRHDDAVARAFGAGAGRVALGTAALRDPSFAARLVDRHGVDRIVASIDVRGGLALGEGWRPGAAGLRAEDAVQALADAGIVTFEVTAIDRDGLLGGPDLHFLGSLVRTFPAARIIASGGIASVDDIIASRDIGCAGAIVGRALYEGRVDLAEALAALAGPTTPAPAIERDR
jgi:phosphoribosylformimino-5-aminoimidazole carboxamide ribotide isomerase